MHVFISKNDHNPKYTFKLVLYLENKKAVSVRLFIFLLKHFFDFLKN